MGQRRNERAGETGDPPGIEPGSPWWEASRLTTQTPLPLLILVVVGYTAARTRYPERARRGSLEYQCKRTGRREPSNGARGVAGKVKWQGPATPRRGATPRRVTNPAGAPTSSEPTRPPGPTRKKSVSDKGDTANRIECAIAAKCKALNCPAVFSSLCVYLWDFQRTSSSNTLNAFRGWEVVDQACTRSARGQIRHRRDAVVQRAGQGRETGWFPRLSGGRYQLLPLFPAVSWSLTSPSSSCWGDPCRENGTAQEYKRGINGISPRKPANQRHRPARSHLDPTEDSKSRFALVGGEKSNRSATAAPGENEDTRRQSSTSYNFGGLSAIADQVLVITCGEPAKAEGTCGRDQARQSSSAWAELPSDNARELTTQTSGLRQRRDKKKLVDLPKRVVEMILRFEEGEERWVWSSAGMQVGGGREIPEKTRRSAAQVQHDSHVRGNLESDPPPAVGNRNKFATAGDERSGRRDTAAPLAKGKTQFGKKGRGRLTCDEQLPGVGEAPERAASRLAVVPVFILRQVRSQDVEAEAAQEALSLLAQLLLGKVDRLLGVGHAEQAPRRRRPCYRRRLRVQHHAPVRQYQQHLRRQHRALAGDGLTGRACARGRPLPHPRMRLVPAHAPRTLFPLQPRQRALPPLLVVDDQPPPARTPDATKQLWPRQIFKFLAAYEYSHVLRAPRGSCVARGFDGEVFYRRSCTQEQTIFAGRATLQNTIFHIHFPDSAGFFGEEVLKGAHSTHCSGTRNFCWWAWPLARQVVGVDGCCKDRTVRARLHSCLLVVSVDSWSYNHFSLRLAVSGDGGGCVVARVRLLASHQGEPGSIPGRATPEFSQVEIVPDSGASRRVFCMHFKGHNDCEMRPVKLVTTERKMSHSFIVELEVFGELHSVNTLTLALHYGQGKWRTKAHSKRYFYKAVDTMNNNRLTKRIINLAISMKVKNNWLLEIERDLQKIGITGDIIQDRCRFETLVNSRQFANKPNIRRKNTWIEERRKDLMSNGSCRTRRAFEQCSPAGGGGDSGRWLEDGEGAPSDCAL
ncbi:hypothetical protein PR048_030174 [Dryococelus australis]|uniref:Uncharacterized protein n=1 Tax=Dryococelus australis TaxID=614101 RepID=A0ABQ9G874_9NEOP|nr:hypothetical protein PR048_030174 [Dryococelus australis]